jgi:hypothetical protein
MRRPISANTFIGIGFETRSRTVALCIRCRFYRGLGIYRLECRPVKNSWTVAKWAKGSTRSLRDPITRCYRSMNQAKLSCLQ